MKYIKLYVHILRLIQSLFVEHSYSIINYNISGYIPTKLYSLLH